MGVQPQLARGVGLVEVFVQVHFDSAEAAFAARERLVRSGVLDRFTNRSGPTVVEEAETVGAA
jgi:hypothetical protein